MGDRRCGDRAETGPEPHPSMLVPSLSVAYSAVHHRFRSPVRMRDAQSGAIASPMRGILPTARAIGRRTMTRHGPQSGPDITCLGIDRCDLDDPASVADADVVVLGAPSDGGTSHRPGTRFGPRAIRMTGSLPHDGSRPRVALRTAGLRDLPVLDAGDVEVGPPFDHADIPAALANRVLLANRPDTTQENLT
jgi:hypothetical protein